VDMPLRSNPEAVLAAFAQLPGSNGSSTGISRAVLSAFVSDHFDPAGDELEEWTPDDWVESPPDVTNALSMTTRHRQFALDLNGVWPTLGRKLSAARSESHGTGGTTTDSDRASRRSLLPVAHPFIIPG
jgi:alpha,alpha-trehalase